MTTLISNHRHTGEISGNPKHQSPRICIVGGGFGGLYTALYLQRYQHLKTAQITLIEPRERFLFTPLLYEILTDELQDWEIAPTYSSLLAGTNITWLQDRAIDIDNHQRQVVLESGETLTYDYLVVATGAAPQSAPIPGLETYALPFRTLQDALTLKARLAQLSATQQSIAVTIIGGGPSGVELATKIAARLGAQAQISLIERGNALLKPFAKGIRRAALTALQQHRVQVYLRTQVSNIQANQIQISLGHESFQLASDLTLWATGTQPLGWPGQRPVEVNEKQQVFVKPTLQLINYPEVFMLGDGAVIQQSAHQSTPNTAQAAYQAADTVAHNLAALIQNGALKSFRYTHLGDMLTLGKGKGGIWSFGLVLTGRLGGLVRQIVYLHRLPTQRHRWKVIQSTFRQLFFSLLSKLLPRRKNNPHKSQSML